MRTLPTLLLAVPLLFHTLELAAQPAIGQWRDHFQYLQTLAVVQGGPDLYCATSTAIFKYNPQSGETERFTKVNNLSDVNILSIGWNTLQNTLLVGYKNGNLDLLGPGGVTNMPDIKRSSVVGDKGIRCITTQGDLAYLGCGFGIVVVDLTRKEVKDTWLIGPDAALLQVNSLAFFNDSIYAATPSGVFAAWQQAPNLAAFTSWHKRMDLPGADGAFTKVLSFNGQLLVNRRVSDVEEDEKDTIYHYNAGWQVLSGAVHDFNRNITVSNDGSVLTVTGRNRLREFDTTLSEVSYIDHFGANELHPRDALRTEPNTVWIATAKGGLVAFHWASDYQLVAPNGPASNTCYRMACAKGALYVTTGGVAGNWSYEYRKEGVHSLVDGRWYTTTQLNDPLFASGGNDYAAALNDVLAIQVDPQDGSHVFVSSWDDGILEMRDRHGIGYFGANNSTLQRFQNGATDDVPTQVAGLAFDDKGNLWATNSNCAQPISVRMKNGAWYAMNTGTVLANNTLLSDIIAAENGYKWVVRPRSSGLFVFSDNGTPSEPGDDLAKVLNTYEGQGKLPSMDVFSVAEDLDGQIWVGTGKGVAVFYNPDLVFSESNFDAQQILIEQDGNWQILLETESVSSIVVDGANRKWLGTQSSGLYLVSADGTEQLAHFTAENSPLPSNNIICMAMDGSTGELFIGTDQGIMSYRGDATEGLVSAECAAVFPNPVRESYAGQVAITGLVRGSDVRITDVAGNVVYHAISKGGQATWPVTDMQGRRVSTGVYLVLVMDPEGKSKCNTKVAVVR
ncbi:MAG: hypothetical protein KBH07_03875 [Flavobacteriales bacterium]|nr:hypothetical protein [Flavobacteriales bacterium]MBP9080688.1 hypothetical protein [Flavobacteriales bacterium]